MLCISSCKAGKFEVLAPPPITTVAAGQGAKKLITALRTAVENGEGMLDKEAASHDDLFDAFRLSLQFWH
jgi:hypothetical protein